MCAYLQRAGFGTSCLLSSLVIGDVRFAVSKTVVSQRTLFTIKNIMGHRSAILLLNKGQNHFMSMSTSAIEYMLMKQNWFMLHTMTPRIKLKLITVAKNWADTNIDDRTERVDLHCYMNILIKLAKFLHILSTLFGFSGCLRTIKLLYRLSFASLESQWRYIEDMG